MGTLEKQAKEREGKVLLKKTKVRDGVIPVANSVQSTFSYLKSEKPRNSQQNWWRCHWRAAEFVLWV
jgi:hypothetical protein